MPSLLPIVAGGSAVALASAVKCPGSASLVHASCIVEATAGASCADVSAELLARIGGQFASWHDPHNNGTYAVVSRSEGEILLTRTSGSKSVGGKQYTDKILFTFSDDEGSCSVTGCSESQVFSVADFSTNYCNIRNLYCGSEDGCSPVKHDFSAEETSVSPSLGAGKDPKACVVDAEPRRPETEPEAAQQTCSLYAFADDMCGQTDLDCKYAAYAKDFQKLLKDGTCAAHNFTVPAGNKTLHVPFIGDITITEYSKKEIQATAGPCCDRGCEAPAVLFFSVDAPHGFCGETCLNPEWYHLFKLFESNLTRSTVEHPCRSLWTPGGSNSRQYTHYFQTVTHGGPGVSATLDLYAPTGMPNQTCCESDEKNTSCRGGTVHLTIFGTGPYCCPPGATEQVPCPAATPLALVV